MTEGKMTNEFPTDDRLKDVWQNQKPEGIHMSVDEIRSKAGSFRKKIYWRNVREYVAALVVVGFSAYMLSLTTGALMRAGFILVIAGVLYVVWHLYRKGSSQSVPEETGMVSGLEYLRSELERQRRLLQSVWRWYLGPLVPGWVLLQVAAVHANPGHLGRFALFLAISNCTAAAAFIFIWRINRRAAKELQRQINELGALQKQE